MGGIHYRAYPDKVTLSANKIYAAIHHFGGKAGRGHKITIPARPCMVVQRDDWREIKGSIMDFIYGGG
jgi:phage virion morphogenesis protein